MAASVSVNTVRDHLYVLKFNNGAHEFFWLTTLATNRHDCWQSARRYVRASDDGDWKAQLKREGHSCVRVKLFELK